MNDMLEMKFVNRWVITCQQEPVGRKASSVSSDCFDQIIGPVLSC